MLSLNALENHRDAWHHFFFFAAVETDVLSKDPGAILSEDYRNNI